MDFYLNINKYDINNVYIQDKFLDKKYLIGNSIFERILNNKYNYLVLVNGLLDFNISDITIYNEQEKIFQINKIIFLEAIFKYLEKNNVENKDILRNDMLDISRKINYKFCKKDGIYKISIDKKIYKFNINEFYQFLELKNEEYEKILKEKKYLGFDLEIFAYALCKYFFDNKIFSKYIFNKEIVERFISLINYENIDFESINKCLFTEDFLKNKYQLSSDVLEIINNKYDSDILKNIIKCYIELCKNFNYDEIYYLDENNPNNLKHNDYTYISKLDKKNNKLVCFEFIGIFGYFLNSLGINYEIIGSNNYGIHSFLIFRFDKYLIKVEAIKSVFDNDLTNVKIKYPLTGIECVNKFTDTKNEFNKILEECYKEEIANLENEYLPANKFNYSNNISDYGKINEYILKIDLIFKKIKSLKLSTIDKLSYFKKLINLVFSSKELDVNVFYTTLTNLTNIIFVIVVNDKSYQNSDNVYIIYNENELSFIKKEELQKKIDDGKFRYLTNKKIPGITEKSKLY